MNRSLYAVVPDFLGILSLHSKASDVWVTVYSYPH